MVVACSSCNHRFEAGGYRDEVCPACGAMGLATRACPRCTTLLVARRIHELVLDDCGKCGGVFIDHASIEHAVAEQADKLLGALPAAAIAGVQAQSPASCPSCATAMHKRMASGGSGIIIDVCAAHGVFFDAGELQTLLAFARREAARAEHEGRPAYKEVVWNGGSNDVRPDPLPPLEHQGLELIIKAFRYALGSGGSEAKQVDQLRRREER